MNNNIIARKVVLQTRKDGNNNYWDTTFTLRPTFRGNSNGQYKVTVNEALFNNTEPLIEKGQYFQWMIETSTGYKFLWKVEMKRDYYLYRQGSDEWSSVIKLLVGALAGENGEPLYKSTLYQKPIRVRYGKDGEIEHAYTEDDGSFSMSISLKNEDGTSFNGTNRGVNPVMFYDVYGINLGGNYGNVTKITMNYSQGFCYILNDLSVNIYEVTDDDEKPNVSDKTGHHYFKFCNLRIGGPYLYILDMPTVKVDVMTMNEANQSYNIVGLAKNTADNHNENIQFISSMEGRVNSLTNFRVRLLNDNFDPVKIISPLYVQITISNDED